jgi:hypothetical protein
MSTSGKKWMEFHRGILDKVGRSVNERIKREVFGVDYGIIEPEKPDEIYFYETEEGTVIIGSRATGFEYKFTSREWTRAQLNEEKRLHVGGLTPQQIYELAKRESQYVDFEEV